MSRALCSLPHAVPLLLNAILTVGAGVLGQTALAASPFLLPEQFDIDPRTTRIAIQSGIAGDNFFVSNRNFKTDYLIQSPDGTSQILPTTAALTKFSLVETEINQSGTYRIQTSNTAPSPTRYALVDGQWLRIMTPRLNAEKPVDKAVGDKGGDKDHHDQAKPANIEAEKLNDGMKMASQKDATPAKPMSMIRAEQLPPDAKISVSNTINTALTYVTKGAPTPFAAFSNKGFEVRPVTHPSEAYATDGFRFAVRYDGKPVVGQSFNVTRGASGYDKDAKRERPAVVTDAEGMAKVSFDQAGVYLIGTTYPAANPDRRIQPPAEVVSFGLTLEVAP